MSSRALPVLTLAFLLGVVTAAGADGPLPLGAGVRLGTLRFRHAGPVASVAYSRDGKLIATACSDRVVRLWNAATGREVSALRGHEAEVRCLAFSPDGKALASGGGDRTVRLWDLATG